MDDKVRSLSTIFLVKDEKSGYWSWSNHHNPEDLAVNPESIEFIKVDDANRGIHEEEIDLMIKDFIDEGIYDIKTMIRKSIERSRGPEDKRVSDMLSKMNEQQEEDAEEEY